MNKQFVQLSFLLLFFLLQGVSYGRESQSFKVAGVFGDNMVLQQGQRIPVWGSAEPGVRIDVKFRKQFVTAKTDNDGKWILWLEPLEISEPDRMTIETDNCKIQFDNVLVGEVWLCSGQSNMEMNVGCTWAKVKNYEAEISNANYPLIRLFIVGRNTSNIPVDTLMSEGWKVCSPETIGDFSATGYFFGRDIHTSQNVPVGLIQSAWGGTVGEAWTSEETLKNLEDFAGIAKKIKELPSDRTSLLKQYKDDLDDWLKETAKADAGINGSDTIFAAFDYDHSDWMEMKVPGMWETTEIGAFDGVVWFRKEVDIPASQVGEDLTLTIAPPDDADETWFNGKKIGESAQWDVVRHYKVPSDIVRKGKNVIAVRLTDSRGNGGFMGENDNFSLFSEDGWRINTGGYWHVKKGYDIQDIQVIPLKPDDPNHPSVLFNGMINPVIPYAIRGVIWYQGESNTGRAKQYGELFPKLIKDWRKHWGTGDFPFYFVQLANFMKCNTEPENDPWAELREAQRKTLDEVPSTGMAVTIDIGDANDIHPSNKQDVGKRLALIARNKIYREEIPCSGPFISTACRKDTAIELTFKHVYNGLKTSDDKTPAGFTIAGEDGQFFKAEATIHEEMIIIRSDYVSDPVVVRYGWNSNPYCNLVNSCGLPASPFEIRVE